MLGTVTPTPEHAGFNPVDKGYLSPSFIIIISVT